MAHLLGLEFPGRRFGSWRNSVAQGQPSQYEHGIGGKVNRPSSRRPRDVNQLAASIVRDSTEETPAEPHPDVVEDTATRRENGRRGGLKGGRARADKLSAEERSEIARKAAQARWTSRRGG